MATAAKEITMLERDRHRPEAAGRDADQSVRLTLGSDRVGPHQEWYDLVDDMILKTTAQPVDPERMGGGDPVFPLVRSRPGPR